MEHIQAIEELGDKVKSIGKLEVELYSIDVSKEENMQAISSYLEKRGSVLNRDTVQSNSFILGNKFNDIWFQEISMVG